MVPCSSSQYHEPVLDIFCWKCVRLCCLLYTLLEITWDWSTDEFSFAIVWLMGWLINSTRYYQKFYKNKANCSYITHISTIYTYIHILFANFACTYLHTHMYICIYQLAVNQNLHRLQTEPLISNQGSTSCDSMMGGGSTVPKPVVFWRVVWWSFR